MQNNDKILSGTFIVDKRFTDTVQLYDKKLDTTTYIDYFKFNNLLFQYFDIDYINKILDKLNNEEKLLIDFDNCKVKRIVQKDPNFIDKMLEHFNSINKEQSTDIITMSLDEW